MITGRELLAWLQDHPNQLDDPVHLLAYDDEAPSYLTAIECDCFDENEGPVISLVSEHEKASEEPAWDVEADTHRISEDHEEPVPVAYAEHERVVLEEIQHRDEAEEWADNLAAALAPASVLGEHSNGNNPWRNALEYARDVPWKREDPPPVRGCGHSGPCDCPPEGIREASEEPAGETKPRTLLGWTVPDHIQLIESAEDVRLVCAQDQTGVLTSRSITGDSRALAFLQAHAHGQPVERQADSEAQR